MSSKNKSYHIELDDDEYETVEYVLPRYIKLVSSFDHEKALNEIEELMKLKETKGSEAMIKKLKQLSKATEKKIKMEKKKKKRKRKRKI